MWGGIRSPETRVVSVIWIGRPYRANRSTVETISSSPR